MNINVPVSPGSRQGSGKEMNLNSVLIYGNIYSLQEKSIGRTESIWGGRAGKVEPPYWLWLFNSFAL